MSAHFFLPAECKSYMVRCWCGARVINGHHCENGHLQDRSSSVSQLLERAEIAFRAMVTMHAMELCRSDLFRRTGRITPNYVHQIARDHRALNRPADQLDATVEAVLAKADALELELQADKECRERQRQARIDEARDTELKARRLR